MGPCDRFAELSRTGNAAKDAAERWRQIVNAWAECYPTIIAEVTDNPDRADTRAREIIRYATGYGLAVTDQQLDRLAAETVKQLQARRAKKENPAQDPTQKRVMKGADPVMMFKGQFVHDATDMTIDGAGIDFEFIRSYRNQAGYQGPLGFNWDHNYNLWLRVSEENIFRSTGGLGTESFVRHRRFGDAGFSYWAPPDGTNAVLLEEGDSFVCRFPNGDRHVYERDAEHPFLHRVTRISDKHGNQLTLAYSDGLLVEVHVNHLRRVVQFTYDDQGRILAVQDYTGRRWRYSYDFFGDLVAVTAPRVPCGSTVRYEYSSVQSPAALQHNLIRIFDAEGRFYLENEYGQEPGLLRFNRVVRQRLGGGDFLFEYEDCEEPLDFEYGDVERPEHVTTLTERNGQRIRHVYNTFGNLLRKEQCVSTGGRERHLVSRYRYNRDGSLVATLTPEGVITQSLFGRDAFVRRFGAADDADLRLHDELSMEVRHGFGRLLATVERGSYLNTASLVFPRGEWGDMFPDILGDPAPADIVRKHTYEPTYGQLRTISDPRFTRSADPGRQSAPLEHPEYEATLTHYFYDGPASDPTLLLDRIVRPRALNPDGTPAPPVIERFPQYDPHGRMLAQIDPAGVRTEYAYFTDTDVSTDGLRTIEGYVKSIVADATDLAIRAEYDVDALGRATVERLPRSSEPQGERFTVRKEYDDDGRVTRVVGPEPFRFEVRRFYDATGMLAREERDALDDTGSPFAGGVQVKTFEYDVELHTVMEATGGNDPETRLVTRHCYDAAGRLTVTTSPADSRVRIEYDERSLPIAQIRGAGTPDQATTRTEYDGDGRVARTISGRGHVTAFVRDPFGQVISQTDPLGHVTRRDYDKGGHVTVERVFERHADGSFALLARTEAEFDTLARRIRGGVNVFSDPLPASDIDEAFLASPGPGRLAVTRNFYDANGRVVRVLDPLLRAVEYEYDALGRLAREREPLGGSATNRYDRHGSLLRRDVIDRFVDPETGTPGQRVFSWAYEYDTLDRRVAETDGLGNVTRYSYDSLGNLVSSTDPLDNRLRKQFDLHGRKTADIIDRFSGGTGGGDPLPPAVIRYEYDGDRNMVNAIDALGRATRQEYDALGRRRASIYSDGSRWTFDYDPDSNPIRIQDANGVIRRLTIDGLGRPVRVSIDTSNVASGTRVGGTLEEIYAYDALGRRTRTENDFVITETRVDSAGYPGRDSITFKVRAPAGLNEFTVEREFSATGTLVGLAYPGGRLVRLHRDDLERLARIENIAKGQDFPGGTVIPEIHDIATFVFAGRQRFHIAYGNGAGIRYRHDRAGRTVEVAHTAAGTPLLRSQQLFDAAGNLRVRTEEEPGGSRTESFQFDSQRRLVRTDQSSSVAFFDASTLAPPAAPQDPIPDAQSALDAMIGPLAVVPGTETIVYDLVGNRISEKTPGGVVPYSVNALDQYTSRGTESFAYDLNGNLVRDGIRQYVYDHASRLVGVSAPGLELEFAHDCLGRRVIERRNSGITLLIHDRDNLIAEYRDAALFAQYVHADGLDRPVQTAVREDLDGAVFWLHADVTSSIRMLTDRAAAPAAIYRYGPFGEGMSETAGAPYNRFRFAGRRLDPDLGSYDFRSRQYHPALGRFLQRDPVGMTTNPNLYTYADNNPLTFTDPLGTSRTDRQTKEATAAKEPPALPPEPRAKTPPLVPHGPAKPLTSDEVIDQYLRENYAKPELAKQHLADYPEQMAAKLEQRDALRARVAQLQQTTKAAVEMQARAREQLDEIRRNDIWPNMGTLNNALTVAGVLVSCYTGSCLIGIGVGVIDLIDNDSGAVAGSITGCVRNPMSAKCGYELASGAGSVLSDRRDQEVKAVRRSAKDEANLLLDRGRRAESAAKAELSNLKAQQDALDDSILFLKKMHEFAKYGYAKDNPWDQAYKIQRPL